MAKQINVGVGGVVKTVKKVPLTIGGVVKEAKKGVCGVGGVVKEFYLSEYALYDNGIENVPIAAYDADDFSQWSVVEGSSYISIVDGSGQTYGDPYLYIYTEELVDLSNYNTLELTYTPVWVDKLDSYIYRRDTSLVTLGIQTSSINYWEPTWTESITEYGYDDNANSYIWVAGTTRTLSLDISSISQACRIRVMFQVAVLEMGSVGDVFRIHKITLK